jgi:hypothetical protein
MLTKALEGIRFVGAVLNDVGFVEHARGGGAGHAFANANQIILYRTSRCCEQRPAHSLQKSKNT